MYSTPGWSSDPTGQGTLKRGSIQLLYVTKVKPNPHDETIGISVLVLKDSNTDFDGDALNGILLIEADAVEKAYNILHPSNRYVDPNSPNVSESITLPNQSLIISNTFLGMV